MRTVITNGRIITATDDFHGDILIEDEQIVAVSSSGYLCYNAERFGT